MKTLSVACGNQTSGRKSENKTSGFTTESMDIARVSPLVYYLLLRMPI
jgi:hypothetical protein